MVKQIVEVKSKVEMAESVRRLNANAFSITSGLQVFYNFIRHQCPKVTQDSCQTGRNYS